MKTLYSWETSTKLPSAFWASREIGFSLLWELQTITSLKFRLEQKDDTMHHLTKGWSTYPLGLCNNLTIWIHTCSACIVLFEISALFCYLQFGTTILIVLHVDKKVLHGFLKTCPYLQKYTIHFDRKSDMLLIIIAERKILKDRAYIILLSSEPFFGNSQEWAKHRRYKVFWDALFQLYSVDLNHNKNCL